MVCAAGSKLELLKKHLIDVIKKREKAVIVSQWVSMLNVVALHLNMSQLAYFEIKVRFNGNNGIIFSKVHPSVYA